MLRDADKVVNSVENKWEHPVVRLAEVAMLVGEDADG